MRRLLPLLLGAILGLVSDAAAAPVRSVRWDGPIGPVTARYLGREIAAAARAGSPLLVIGLDTPGGLDPAMRSIIKDIAASPVPVAVWVGPPGSRAASAGCVIGLAAHLLVMAPGTNIGAAHPVSVGGAPMDTIMAGKVVRDAEAYVEALARQRGRNESWARDAVRLSLSASAEEAVRLGVADYMAGNLAELLAGADGRSVRLPAGTATLATRGLPVEERTPDWRTGLLALVNDPNVAYILLLLGLYGLFFELANPGALFPGIFGVIALITGLYALSNLPLNWAGLLLLLAGLLMLLLEIKIVSHGLLTVGGLAALLMGSLMLVDSPLPFFRISLAVIIPAVLVTGGFFLFLVGRGLSAQRRPHATGGESFVGRTAVVRERLDPRGTVFLDGTHWTAESAETIEPGQLVRVVGVDHLSLKVRRDR